MNGILKTLTLMAVLLLVTPQITWGNPSLALEPPIEKRLSWEVLPNRMLIISYDLDGNGKADFYAFRTITRSFFSHRNWDQERQNFPDKIVFNVEHTASSYYYVVEKGPTLYSMDVNEDGHWDLLFKDPMGDGVNGNETFFDSPSGMFVSCPGLCDQ